MSHPAIRVSLCITGMHQVGESSGGLALEQMFEKLSRTERLSMGPARDRPNAELAPGEPVSLLLSRSLSRTRRVLVAITTNRLVVASRSEAASWVSSWNVAGKTAEGPCR